MPILLHASPHDEQVSISKVKATKAKVMTTRASFEESGTFLVCLTNNKLKSACDQPKDILTSIALGDYFFCEAKTL